MDVLEPFLPDLLITPDHSLSDIKAECKALAIVQRMLEKFLQGVVTLDEFDACLEGYGIYPPDYWGVVEENVEAVVQAETALDHHELILVAR